MIEFDSKPAHTGHVLIAIEGEPLAIRSVDRAMLALVSYDVVSAPAGSTAKMTADGHLTPDKAGEYTLAAKAGAVTTQFKVRAFPRHVAEHDFVTKYQHGASAGQVRPPAAQRELLARLARHVEPAVLDAWATRALPVGACVSVTTFGE